MKIGVIFCGYNMKNYIPESIAPWIEARNNKLADVEFVLSAVSIPFANFENEREDGTQELLQSNKYLDVVFTEPRGIQEWEARDLALQYLLSQEVDFVWQVDFDEFYTIRQIENIVKFINTDPFISWYKLSFKNYVFNEKTFIFEPFTPPRIHRVKSGRHVLDKFVYDNDINYLLDGKEVKQSSLSHRVSPKGVAWIKHLTWLDDDRSRRKVKYHTDRGWICSYKWTDKGLEFNEEYYKNNISPKPVLFTE